MLNKNKQTSISHTHLRNVHLLSIHSTAQTNKRQIATTSTTLNTATMPTSLLDLPQSPKAAFYTAAFEARSYPSCR
jgi:hypothetical protein